LRFDPISPEYEISNGTDPNTYTVLPAPGDLSEDGQIDISDLLKLEQLLIE